MDKDKQPIDDLFRELKGWEKAGSFDEVYWDALDARLNKRKRRLFLWVSLAGLALVISGLLIGISGNDPAHAERLYKAREEAPTTSTPTPSVPITTSPQGEEAGSMPTLPASETTGINEPSSTPVSTQSQRPDEKTNIPTPSANRSQVTSIARSEPVPEKAAEELGTTSHKAVPTASNLISNEPPLRLAAKQGALTTDPVDFSIRPWRNLVPPPFIPYGSWFVQGQLGAVSNLDEGSNMAYVIGGRIQYAYRFKPSWHLETGLGLSAETGHSLIYETHEAHYFINRSERFTSIETRTVLVAEAPIAVGWKIRSRHEVRLGGYVQAVLQSRSQYRVRTTGEFFSDESPDSPQFGYHQLLETWDGGFLTGYRFSLDPTWKIGFEARWGLTNRLNETYFRGSEIQQRAIVLTLSKCIGTCKTK